MPRADAQNVAHPGRTAEYAAHAALSRSVIGTSRTPLGDFGLSMDPSRSFMAFLTRTVDPPTSSGYSPSASPVRSPASSMSRTAMALPSPEAASGSTLPQRSSIWPAVEFALMATGYNLARAMSLLGFGGLMEAVRG